jgi:hypothetical protein
MTETNPSPPPVKKKKKKATKSDANFADILEKTPADANKVLLPKGCYLCHVDAYVYAKFGEDDTPCIDFILKPLEAVEVDPEQFDQALEIIEIATVEIRHRLFVTEFGCQECSQKSPRKLIQFLDRDLGISVGVFAEAIANAVGKQVIVTIGHKTSQDGSQIFLVVRKTAKAPART